MIIYLTLMEYNVKASILYLLCPRDFMSQARHFCHVAVFSFHVVMSCCMSLSPRRYLLSCGLDFQSHLSV